MLENNINDKDELTRILLDFDNMLKYIHNNGFCIYDFNLKRIKLDNGKLTLNSFNGLLNDMGISQNMRAINIYQLAKIGLMAYNNQIVDGTMNQEHFDFINQNLEQFNSQGTIPNEIYEYYDEIFRRLNIIYMHDYLNMKEQETNNNQNSNVIKKSLSTSVGRAYAKEDSNAYVSILFIPSVLVLVYFMILILQTFIFK